MQWPFAIRATCMTGGEEDNRTGQDRSGVWTEPGEGGEGKGGGANAKAECGHEGGKQVLWIMHHADAARPWPALGIQPFRCDQHQVGTGATLQSNLFGRAQHFRQADVAWRRDCRGAVDEIVSVAHPHQGPNGLVGVQRDSHAGGVGWRRHARLWA